MYSFLRAFMGPDGRVCIPDDLQMTSKGRQRLMTMYSSGLQNTRGTCHPENNGISFLTMFDTEAMEHQTALTCMPGG